MSAFSLKLPPGFKQALILQSLKTQYEQESHVGKLLKASMSLGDNLKIHGHF